MGLGGVDAAEIVLCLHGHVTVFSGEDIASHRCLGTFDAVDFGQLVGGEVVVPLGVAYVLLRHHAVPLAVGHGVVVVVAELLVAGEGFFHLVCPLVGGGIALGVELQVHGLGVIHLVEVGHGLHGE